MKHFFFCPSAEIEPLANAANNPSEFNLVDIAIAACIGVSRTGIPFSGDVDSDGVQECVVDGIAYHSVALVSDFDQPHDIVIDLGNEFAGDSITEEQAQIIANNCFVKSDAPDEVLMLTSLNYSATVFSSSDISLLCRNVMENHNLLSEEGLLTQDTDSVITDYAAHQQMVSFSHDMPNRFLDMCTQFSAEIDGNYFIRNIHPLLGTDEFMLAEHDDIVIMAGIDDFEIAITKSDILEAKYDSAAKEWDVGGYSFNFFNLVPVTVQF